MQQYTLCMTNSPEIYEECQKLYFNTKYLKFALGFNPQTNNSEESFRLFVNKFKSAEYIGEVGLDFSKKILNSNKKQVYFFDEIVKMCSDSNKILSVHSRLAEEKVIEIIEKYKPRKCIIHWFSGNKEQLRKLIDLGCYFSINTSMLNDKIFLIPKDRILMESDGPFTKVNGKKYQPQLLKEQYKIISNYLRINNLDDLMYNNFFSILTLR